MLEAPPPLLLVSEGRVPLRLLQGTDRADEHAGRRVPHHGGHQTGFVMNEFPPERQWIEVPPPGPRTMDAFAALVHLYENGCSP